MWKVQGKQQINGDRMNVLTVIKLETMLWRQNECVDSYEARDNVVAWRQALSFIMLAYQHSQVQFTGRQFGSRLLCMHF